MFYICAKKKIKYNNMLDVGLTTFMILATSLVMLMTPGLAFFYGGLGCSKNILSIMMQSFVSMGIGTVLWFAFGYSLCFSGNHRFGFRFFWDNRKFGQGILSRHYSFNTVFSR